MKSDNKHTLEKNMIQTYNMNILAPKMLMGRAFYDMISLDLLSMVLIEGALFLHQVSKTGMW
jgi:hypothetical protein